MTKLLSQKTSVVWALAALALMTTWCSDPVLAADRMVIGELFGYSG